MNRRDFLRNAALLAAGTVAVSQLLRLDEFVVRPGFRFYSDDEWRALGVDVVDWGGAKLYRFPGDPLTLHWFDTNTGWEMWTLDAASEDSLYNRAATNRALLEYRV